MALHLCSFHPWRLVFLSLSLFLEAAATSETGFISIDCGASNSYTDTNGIRWETDEAYISSGESRQVRSATSVSTPMKTLRVFSSRKNCYFIKLSDPQRILVRASFYYGNYDNKVAPPSFQLQFDGNTWATVVIDMTQIAYSEAIYEVSDGKTSICVAQAMPKQLPFVSSIEVRPLDKTTYNVNPSYAVFTLTRESFGAISTLRYPDDEYDRIWYPATPTGVYFNGVSVSDPFIPSYQRVLEVSHVHPAVKGRIEISLQPTTDATLPPIISAMEIFTGSIMSAGTASSDVEGLAIIQRQFKVLSDCNGESCLPENFSCDGVECSSDPTPRVIAMNLAGYGLSGDLPDFSALTALQIIYMHNNKITGDTPDFLGSLPNLIQLNLADNKLSGTIPPSLTKNNRIKLMISGNPGLCSSGQACDNSNSKKTSSKIIAVAVPVCFIAFVGIAVTLFLRRRRVVPPIATIDPEPGKTQSNGHSRGSARSNGHEMFGANPEKLNPTHGMQFSVAADQRGAAPGNPSASGNGPAVSEGVSQEQPMLKEVAYQETRWG